MHNWMRPSKIGEYTVQHTGLRMNGYSLQANVFMSSMVHKILLGRLDKER
jgi:hypothetical protein